ncbi:MAG: AraC family ligand binding domain-containing protein [Candidatus Protistobacter heckmanni]|nr:AraC family ligand binding domain-containing protein [Candidatus Protistobacter heckmanni]
MAKAAPIKEAPERARLWSGKDPAAQLQRRELYQNTPHPAAAMAVYYPHGHVIPPHMHRHAQLVYAISGVMIVATAQGLWVVPPTRGVWIPASVQHWIRMAGDVHMRTVYIESGAAAHLPDACCASRFWRRWICRSTIPRMRAYAASATRGSPSRAMRAARRNGPRAWACTRRRCTASFSARPA